MFWSSNCWRSRNHSFHFCKVYVSLTARILPRVIVSQLEHKRKKIRQAFRWTFQINSLSLDAAYGHWLLRVGGTKITKSWGGGGRVFCPQNSRSEKQIVVDCSGQRTCKAGKQDHFFTGHYIKLTQKLYFTKALIEQFSVFQELKAISRNLTVILGNYKPHRELTFSYTTHRGWMKSELFFSFLQRYVDMDINRSVNWFSTSKQVPKKTPQQNPNKFP